MNAAHHQAAKLSRNQGQVLSALRKAKEPLSAYAILDRVRVAGHHGSCNGKAAFAICRQCQKVVEISLSDKDERVLLALTPEEIAAEQITLEIAGLCEACRPAKAT